jgi:hypothetical protein
MDDDELTVAPPLKVGDRLWLVEARGRTTQGNYVIVSKVGRKWATITDAEHPARQRGRIDLRSLYVDNSGFGLRDRCYLSRQQYEDEVAADKAWREFRSEISTAFRRPSHVTINMIEQAKAALARSVQS